MLASLIDFLSFGSLVALKVAAAILAVAWLVRRTFSRDEDAPCFGWRYCIRQRAKAESAYRRFSRDLASIREKKELLDQYTPEYYHTLKTAGLDDLADTVKFLSAADQSLRDDLSSKRYSRVMLLAYYLSGELRGEYLQRAREQFSGWRALEKWRARVDQTLSNLSESLSEAANQTKHLGVKRPRERKPTLVAAAEIRRDLLD